MSKILFTPFSMISGLLAGAVAKKLFAGLWSLIDHQQPPDPKHREETWLRVVLALVLEGAIFRAVRGLLDRAAREAFSRLTGTWPGEGRPEPTR